MATYTDATHVDSDWLKWEEDGWFSRENAPLLAGSGVVVSGTVMVLSGGKLTPMATTQGASAVGLILASTDGKVWYNSAVDQPAAYIARNAIVADKAITWKTGVLTADKTAAIAALKLLGIQVREAV
jgi:Bacteriophage lambda head decoration protein D